MLHTTPLYGGTHGLLYGPLAGLGIGPVPIADALSRESVEAAAETALEHGPIALIHVESPANPTAGIADIAMIAAFAGELGEAPGEAAGGRRSTTPSSARSCSGRWSTAPTSASPR